jgi:hypothetical protein
VNRKVYKKPTKSRREEDDWRETKRRCEDGDWRKNASSFRAERIVALYAKGEGLTITQLGMRFGKSNAMIRDVLKRNGVLRKQGNTRCGASDCLL